MMVNKSEPGQQQINRKHADEWSAFDSFHAHVYQLLKGRHHQEKAAYSSLTKPDVLAECHRREVAEFSQAKALAAKLLREEQQKEKLDVDSHS